MRIQSRSLEDEFKIRGVVRHIKVTSLYDKLVAEAFFGLSFVR